MSFRDEEDKKIYKSFLDGNNEAIRHIDAKI